MDLSTTTLSSKHELLRDLLKRVSRLFYTTLVVVPADVRDQVSDWRISLPGLPIRLPIRN